MRARTRTRLLYVTLVAATLATSAWLFPLDNDWSSIVAAILLLVALVLIAVWASTTPTSPYLAPEILGERFGRGACFETDGLCFASHFDVEDRLLWLRIYYQNRYTGPCRASVAHRLK